VRQANGFSRKNKFRPLLEGAQPMVHPQETGETRYKKAKKT
jgi:hypothetical protein